MMLRVKQSIVLAAVLLSGVGGAFAAQNDGRQVWFFNYLDQPVTITNVIASANGVTSLLYPDIEIDRVGGFSCRIGGALQAISFTIDYGFDMQTSFPLHQLHGDETDIYVVIDALYHVVLTARAPGENGYRVLNPIEPRAASPALTVPRSPILTLESIAEREEEIDDEEKAIDPVSVTTLPIYEGPLAQRYAVMTAATGDVHVARRSSEAGVDDEDTVMVLSDNADSLSAHETTPAAEGPQQPTVGLLWWLLGY